MITDEEILAEERLPAESEVLLYNISLRQDDMRTQSTDMLLSQLQAEPAYQEMIDKGLLAYDVLDRGSVPVANLRVTMKGLRYCVLYSEEIEPRRQMDIAGNLRGFGVAPHTAEDGPHVAGANSRVVYPSMIPAGALDNGVGLALSEDQLQEIAEIGAKIAEANQHQHELSFGERSEERSIEIAPENHLTYVVLDDSFVQLTGAKIASKSFAIPETIEGKPVLAISAGAFSRGVEAEEIVCADCIEIIGNNAFRGNPQLRKIVLPENAAEFKASWVDQCPNLEELVLPGMMDKVKRGVLSNGRLKRLVIGKGVQDIEAGTFQGSSLEEIVIDEHNPFLAADGSAIYSKDGKLLVALACPVSTLDVSAGCECIGKKCFHGFKSLEDAQLPDTVVEIGPFAFSDTGLERFVAPESLRRIDEKAFLNCSQLRSVELNEGLEFIGDSAFQGSGISELFIPRTIKEIGTSITKGTDVVHSGPHCSLRIDERCEEHFFDGNGGLYRRDEDGLHLVQLVDGELESYKLHEGTVGIDSHAFAHHEHIQSVWMPDTVRSIGPSAFRVCKNLRNIQLPDSVETIGEEAFFDTNIEEFRVPANLRELGNRALVTYGAHTGKSAPSIVHIEGSSANDRFYVICGLLCRKTDNGASVVIGSGEEPRVEFPEEITHVEDYALNNAQGIEYLSLNPNLSVVGANGLSAKCWIQQIRIELGKPVEGRQTFDFFFPNTPSGIRGISLGLGSANWVNVPGIAEQRDICLTTAHDYNTSRGSDDISAYEQAQLILERFDDPILLTPGNRNAMEKVLRNNIVDICVDVALHDDREVLDELFDKRLITPENLDEVIERVTALRDAATSAHLLEAKRLRFSQDAFDYDL